MIIVEGDLFLSFDKIADLADMIRKMFDHMNESDIVEFNVQPETGFQP